MTEYIERGKSLEQLIPMAEASAKLHDGIMTAVSQIRNQPAADVRPMEHGYWKPIYDTDADMQRGRALYYECSRCGRAARDETYSYDPACEFCPHCGAEMNGEEEW